MILACYHGNPSPSFLGVITHIWGPNIFHGFGVQGLPVIPDTPLNLTPSTDLRLIALTSLTITAAHGVGDRTTIYATTEMHPGSMYGIFTDIYHNSQPNGGEYTIHGFYRNGFLQFKATRSSSPFWSTDCRQNVWICWVPLKFISRVAWESKKSSFRNRQNHAQP